MRIDVGRAWNRWKNKRDRAVKKSSRELVCWGWLKTEKGVVKEGEVLGKR